MSIGPRLVRPGAGIHSHQAHNCFDLDSRYLMTVRPALIKIISDILILFLVLHFLSQSNISTQIEALVRLQVIHFIVVQNTNWFGFRSGTRYFIRSCAGSLKGFQSLSAIQSPINKNHLMDMANSFEDVAAKSCERERDSSRLPTLSK
jgi:hypothetical protein